MNRNNPLLLDNQICFPLYAASREIIKHYRPYLEEIDLTYTQYVTMLVLWEEKKISVGELGRRLFLDSGTLTPVLKTLEAKKLLKRYRSTADERVLIVEITDAGEALRDRAVTIPPRMASCVSLTPEEAGTLYRLLYKILGREKGQD